MDREVVGSVHLGVMLVSLGALLLIILYTVRAGDDLKRDIYDTASTTVGQMQTGQLQTLLGNETIMPVAAVYNILIQNYSGVNTLTYTTRGAGSVTTTIEMKTDGLWGDINTTKGTYVNVFDPLNTLLSGKVAVQVVTADVGGYDVVLRNVD